MFTCTNLLICIQGLSFKHKRNSMNILHSSACQNKIQRQRKGGSNSQGIALLNLHPLYTKFLD